MILIDNPLKCQECLSKMKRVEEAQNYQTAKNYFQNNNHKYFILGYVSVLFDTYDEVEILVRFIENLNDCQNKD